MVWLVLPILTLLVKSFLVLENIFYFPDNYSKLAPHHRSEYPVVWKYPFFVCCLLMTLMKYISWHANIEMMKCMKYWVLSNIVTPLFTWYKQATNLWHTPGYSSPNGLITYVWYMAYIKPNVSVRFGLWSISKVVTHQVGVKGEGNYRYRRHTRDWI